MDRVLWVTCLFLSEDDEDLAAKAARLQAVGFTPLASSLNLDLGLVCLRGRASESGRAPLRACGPRAGRRAGVARVERDEAAGFRLSLAPGGVYSFALTPEWILPASISFPLSAYYHHA